MPSNITGQAMARIMLDEFGAERLWQRYGEERTLAIAKLAGEDTDALKARMTETPADAPNSVTIKGGPGYDQDPAHDPRVTDAIMAGKPWDEINTIMREVTAEMTADPHRPLSTREVIARQMAEDEADFAERTRAGAERATQRGVTQTIDYSDLKEVT